ncbi:MAG: protein-(glutamine-N5) methyltransferase, release factor-specific [Gammaproteobacteria bacterium]|nr:MAG: protein-(glutamine-N5) methyltransferase, release factor-specific [Gammaproteobacteria bacterium]
MRQTTIREWLNEATAVIQSPSPRLDAELLLAYRLGTDRVHLFTFDDDNIPAEVVSLLNGDLQRLSRGYPLAYLTGKKAFWDMELTVSEDTLIPRPDTETLLENLLTLLSADFSGKIIDLGTGSGAIAIAISRLFVHADIYATDISPNAIKVAQRNAQDWQRSTIRFCHADWFNPLDDSVLPKQFDVIISNPPYIEGNDPHLKHLPFEPTTALTSPDNGLSDIKKIIKQSTRRLHQGGWLLLEHGYDQGQAVRDLFDLSHWQAVKTNRDLCGQERITMAQRLTQPF